MLKKLLKSKAVIYSAMGINIFVFGVGLYLSDLSLMAIASMSYGSLVLSLYLQEK